MGLLDGLFKKGIDDTVAAVGGVIDTISTSDEEKLDKKNQLAKIVTDSLTQSLSIQAAVLQSETTGNALQRNWRPIVMLAFAFIVVYRYFIAPVFHLELIDMPEQFWSLLELGIGGYVIGRTVEKTANTLTKNVDLTFLKKKDRKDAEEN
jgi:hypothetical protein